MFVREEHDSDDDTLNIKEEAVLLSVSPTPPISRASPVRRASSDSDDDIMILPDPASPRIQGSLNPAVTVGPIKTEIKLEALPLPLFIIPDVTIPGPVSEFQPFSDASLSLTVKQEPEEPVEAVEEDIPAMNATGYYAGYDSDESMDLQAPISPMHHVTTECNKEVTGFDIFKNPESNTASEDEGECDEVFEDAESDVEDVERPIDPHADINVNDRDVTEDDMDDVVDDSRTAEQEVQPPTESNLCELAPEDSDMDRFVDTVLQEAANDEIGAVGSGGLTLVAADDRTDDIEPERNDTAAEDMSIAEKDDEASVDSTVVEEDAPAVLEDDGSDQQDDPTIDWSAHLEDRSGALDKQSSALDEQADDLDEQAGDHDEQADDLDEQADDLDKQSSALDEQADDLDEQADDLDEEPGHLDKQSSALDEQADDLDEQADDLDEEPGHLDEQPETPGISPEEEDKLLASDSESDVDVIPEDINVIPDVSLFMTETPGPNDEESLFMPPLVADGSDDEFSILPDDDPLSEAAAETSRDVEHNDQPIREVEPDATVPEPAEASSSHQLSLAMKALIATDGPVEVVPAIITPIASAPPPRLTFPAPLLPLNPTAPITPEQQALNILKRAVTLSQLQVIQRLKVFVQFRRITLNVNEFMAGGSMGMPYSVENRVEMIFSAIYIHIARNKNADVNAVTRTVLSFLKQEWIYLQWSDKLFFLGLCFETGLVSLAIMVRELIYQTIRILPDCLHKAVEHEFTNFQNQALKCLHPYLLSFMATVDCFAQGQLKESLLNLIRHKLEVNQDCTVKDEEVNVVQLIILSKKSGTGLG